MRYLSVVSTPALRAEIASVLGESRIRSIRGDEAEAELGGERFAAIIADRSGEISLLDRGLPVLLPMALDRPGVARFGAIAGAGLDVRLWNVSQQNSEMTVRPLVAPRAPLAAAVTLHALRGCFTGLTTDVFVAAALSADARRTMEDIARILGASPGAIRNSLKENGIDNVAAVVARMRCLQAMWTFEGDQPNYWRSAGFRTHAEASEFLSRNCGAPIGRWRAQGGFAALLRDTVASYETATATGDRRAG